VDVSTYDSDHEAWRYACFAGSALATCECMTEADHVSRRLAAIVGSSDDAIIGKNLDGTITSWNRGAEIIFGYTAHETIGQSIRMIIPPERHDEEDAVLRRIRQGEFVRHFETMRRRKDGSLVPVSLTISPIRDDAGVVTGASTIARDISERQQLMVHLQQQVEVTQKLNTIASTVASELDRDTGGLRKFSQSSCNEPVWTDVSRRGHRPHR
jgi:PAS domain S-box-containing protein